MKRILLDQGLSPAAAALLCADGWGAVHVIGIGLDRAEEIGILEFAGRDKRVCLTLDHDFLLHRSKVPEASGRVFDLRLDR